MATKQEADAYVKELAEENGVLFRIGPTQESTKEVPLPSSAFCYYFGWAAKSGVSSMFAVFENELGEFWKPLIVSRFDGALLALFKLILKNESAK